MTYREFQDVIAANFAKKGLSRKYVSQNMYIKDFEKVSGKVRAQYLMQNPEVDALRAIWGYSETVHSPRAMKLYYDRTGLGARMAQS